MLDDQRPDPVFTIIAGATIVMVGYALIAYALDWLFADQPGQLIALVGVIVATMLVTAGLLDWQLSAPEPPAEPPEQYEE